jgi:radical SAM superfamily enzyme YgiQ (UPF0313 family)
MNRIQKNNIVFFSNPQRVCKNNFVTKANLLSRKRKIILASLDWTRPKDPPISLGHASIWAKLLSHDIKVVSTAWAVNNVDFSPTKVVEAVMSYANEDTDFAIGAFVWNEFAVQAILNQLKKQRFPGRIIIGGPQVSYVKRGLEQFYPQADIFIRGYAEEALAKLLLAGSNFSTSTIKGVHFAHEPDWSLSADVNFDELPSPYLTGIIQPQRFIRWETQRGCPFQCSFCQHREPNVAMKRKHFSLSRVLKEAQWITDNPIIQDIAVLDPTFNSGSQYLTILDVLIERGYSGKLALQCRAEMVTNEFLDKVEKLNQSANVVLEFGLQTIHKEEQRLIERPNNLKKVISVFEETCKRKIDTEISLIFGLPQQTVSSFQASVNFCVNLGATMIHAYPLMLLRGTPLYDLKQKLQLKESNDITIPEIDRLYNGIPHVVSSPTFTYAEWLQMATIAKDLEINNQRTLRDHNVLEPFPQSNHSQYTARQ